MHYDSSVALDIIFSIRIFIFSCIKEIDQQNTTNEKFFLILQKVFSSYSDGFTKHFIRQPQVNSIQARAAGKQDGKQ